jgi:NAD(P)-dependent dehydrogenase (short-subunit alcohol dehydrogenase family)
MGEGKMTMREAWNKSWDVNTTGTQIVTYTFVPLLLKSGDPRLLFITSGTSTMAESTNTSLAVNRSPAKGWPKPFTGVPAYRASKTDMNMMMREWVRILKEDNVKVFCISPGMLATGLGGRPEMLKKIGALDPSIGANFIRDVVEGARDQDVGKIIRKDNVQPW